jgi:hypothetical protein
MSWGVELNGLDVLVLGVAAAFMGWRILVVRPKPVRMAVLIPTVLLLWIFFLAIWIVARLYR